MTLGAGRIIDMDMTRISKALTGGGVARNPVLDSALRLAEREGRPLHLLGLLSDGGVHSHLDHLVEILRECARRGVRPALHAFLDGRDTPPSSGLGYVRQVLPEVQAANGWIATVVGRYFAMDRDNRWERVAQAYHALVLGEGGAGGRRRGGRRGRLRRGRDRRVRRAAYRLWRLRASRTATPCSSSTSAPTAPASSRTR